MKKRIERLLCALLGCALLLGACGGAACAEGTEEKDMIGELIASMSLRDKLAQMMFFSPRTWKEDPESEEAAEKVRALSELMRDYIAGHRFGGILLFDENCGDAEQTLRLVADMQMANREGGGLPMFIAADQEGGLITRLPFATRGVGAMALAATGDPESAREMARVYGEDLAALGINVDFAPVLDVNDNPNNPVIGDRAFSDDAGTVAAFGGAFMAGLEDAGVIGTLKHFPGHGNTDTDSHTGLPLVNRTHDELAANELIPFKAAIDAGAEMVMTAHIQFPQLESQTYTSVTTGEEVYIPATMSKAILTGILREELGYEGVIVSDALGMDAIVNNYAMDDVLTMTVNAGVNMLILPVVRDSKELEAVGTMLDRAVALAEAGTIEAERVDDSVRRILALKQRHGLLDREDFALTDADVASAKAHFDGRAGWDTAWEIAEKSLTLLKNENDAFPLKVGAGEKALILFTAASRAGTGELAAKLLAEAGALPEGAEIESMVIGPDTAEACEAAAAEADQVLLVSRAWNVSCLNPETEDGFPVGVVNRIIDALHAAGRTAVVISAQLPYDAACYPEADALLLCYCSTPMRSLPPESGEGSGWSPSLPAAICAAFGMGEPAGALPVDLPALDGDYQLTDRVLYPRQTGPNVARNALRARLKNLEDGRLARLDTPAGKLTALEAMPEQEWQKTAVFPDWKGYTDDTLAMNSMLSFRGYHGQGALYLRVDPAVESFSLLVNGRRFDADGAGGGAWAADISDAALDSVNTLQIANIRPLGLKGAVEVCVPYPVVLEGDGGLEGIRPEALRLISDIIQADIDNGFTSAQLAVVRNGRLVYENAWGRLNSYDPDGTPKADGPMATVDTLYDLASVTKVFTVNYAIQKLATDGLLDLDATIVELLGEGFADDTLDFAYEGVEDAPDVGTQREWKRALTVKDALRHQAGFPASPHYNDADYDMAAQDVGEPGSNLCYARSREETLAAIRKTPLLYAPGAQTVYSDVDYMLLGFVVEAVTGRRLDAYMRESFFEPMGLERVCFLPLENGFAPEDCAATELNGNTRDGNAFFEGIRTETLQGEVQDERAWHCMEGVSGHAGLFANARDLAKLASVMLTGGYGEHRFFSRNVMDAFTAPKAVGYGQWGLGWWREGDDQRAWYFGTQSAPGTVGHQGWTGTLVMVDPSRELAVAYLTNKINTPVLGSEQRDRFRGGCYTASTLGFVPQILSIGMDGAEDVTGQLTDLLADMAAESLKLIPEDAGEDEPHVKNARAKLDVLEKWMGEL